MVTISGIEYSEKEWKKAIKSNDGLFKRLNSVPSNIQGPQLTKEGDIQGDSGAIENMDLNLCTSEQQNAFEQLRQQDKVKAWQFLFVITNAYIVWKKDIEELNDILLHLQIEEKELLSEEELIRKAEKIKDKMDPVIERHFPGEFTKLREDLSDLEEFAKDIETAVSHFKAIEIRIKQHLEVIKKGFPFLFE